MDFIGFSFSEIRNMTNKIDNGIVGLWEIFPYISSSSFSTPNWLVELNKNFPKLDINKSKVQFFLVPKKTIHGVQKIAGRGHREKMVICLVSFL